MATSNARLVDAGSEAGCCPEYLQVVLGTNLAMMYAHRLPVTEPLLQQPDPVIEHAQPSEQTPSEPVQSESAAPLPSQTGTLKVLALVLLAVAILVGAAALLSNSGVGQPGGPPPVCRKSAALAVLRQEDVTTYAYQAAGADKLQLIIWGGKGKRAEVVFDDTHIMNLKDRKWHAIEQTGGFVKQVVNHIPGLRNIWKTAPTQDSLQGLPAQLPASRWKQVTSTDSISNNMIMFGGDGMDSDGSNTGNGHVYLNDAWQLSLDNGKAKWQELWNTSSNGEYLAIARWAMLLMPFTCACIVQNTGSAANNNYLVRSAAGGLACIAEPTIRQVEANLISFCMHPHCTQNP